MSRPAVSFPCPVPGHDRSTLVETQGLGGFHPVEVYECAAPGCGHRHLVRVMHEAEDTGWAPEPEPEPTGWLPTYPGPPSESTEFSRLRRL